MKTIILKGVNNNHFPEITPVSDDQVSVVLAAATAQAITIPSSANYAIFNTDLNFFAAYDTAVALPGAVTGQASTDTEYNPGARFVGDKSVINLISEDATYVHISFYS